MRAGQIIAPLRSPSMSAPMFAPRESARESALEPTTSRSRPLYTREPAPRFDAKVHARRLITYMYEGSQPLAPGDVLARDLMQIYPEMLADLGCDEARPWPTLSRYLKESLGARTKTYGWFYDDAGGRHRLRYYRFPKVNPVSEPPVESTGFVPAA